MDERLALLNKEKEQALNTSNNTYGDLIQENQNLYNQQIDYSNQSEQIQNDVLDKQLAFQNEQIEKQKEVARQNQQTESKKALNDYTSFVNPYGVQAESQASSGLLNSGLSETTKLGGFNTYQNRLATANKAMQDAFTQYDTDMNEARLNNDVQKAQNALAKLEMQLQYAQNYYDTNSSLSQNQLSNNQNLTSEYNNQYNTVYNQLQAQKEFEEQVRQYNEQMAYQREQDALAQANWEREYALANKSSSSNSYDLTSGNSTGTDLTGSTSANGRTIIANPYTNTVNPDAQYGVFEYSESPGSGYQPNNIGGSKLSKSNYKVGQLFVGAIGSTGADISKQSIWTVDGNYYVWDGSVNDYIDVTEKVNAALKYQGPHRW